MKKENILLAALATTFASCRDANGKLPNASITGETPWDLVPWWMMGIGALFLVYTGIDYVINKQAYTNKALRPSTKWFVFGVGGAILLIMGFVIYAS